jgi:spermidine dehydrogenase
MNEGSVKQFADMFVSSGFDPKQDIAGIVLNRWGHAFVNPQLGFFFGTGGKPAARSPAKATVRANRLCAYGPLRNRAHLSAIVEAHRAVYRIWGAVS